MKKQYFLITFLSSLHVTIAASLIHANTSVSPAISALREGGFKNNCYGAPNNLKTILTSLSGLNKPSAAIK